MASSLDESLSFFKDKVSECVKAGKSVFVTTHIDCDGLAAGSIIVKSLVREGAKCTLRTSKEFSKEVIRSFRKDSRDFHIIMDLGGGFAKDLDEALGDNWAIIDHHQINEEEMENQRVINSWKYGIDGGTDICSGGMAYLAATALDKKNSDMSPIAVISALGDQQDQGERKSLTGKNFEIAATARDLGLLEIDLDLLLAGRETRSLPDALALTAHPFVEGMTWNRDACVSFLDSSGIRLKEGGRWRTPIELSEGEKRKMLETMAEFASEKNSTEFTEEMIGYTYTLTGEDKVSFLRDGREFSSMLDSCGRNGHSGAGIAVCVGDRGKRLIESESVLMKYREKVRECMNILLNERWRVLENKTHVMVNGEDIMQETMTGTISSLISGMPKNYGKIVITRTKGEENTVKFSARKSIGCKFEIDLSKMMSAGAKRVGGLGGGHNRTAGARITKNKLDEFINYLEENVTNISGTDSA